MMQHDADVQCSDFQPLCLQMCSIILAVVLIITAALSATALLACRYQFWTFLQDASVSPVYTLR